MVFWGWWRTRPGPAHVWIWVCVFLLFCQWGVGRLLGRWVVGLMTGRLDDSTLECVFAACTGEWWAVYRIIPHDLKWQSF